MWWFRTTNANDSYFGYENYTGSYWLTTYPGTGHLHYTPPDGSQIADIAEEDFLQALYGEVQNEASQE